tara:strand:+ start:1439 stop:1648 length:210 start_codon:yes stop_codon:yes gene_type:complete
MKNNTKNNYKGFVRSTSNILTNTNQYQVSLPPHIWKKMKWKLNENVRLIINKETETLEIRRDDASTKEI